MHPSEVARHRAIIRSSAREHGTIVTSNLDDDTAENELEIVSELTRPGGAYARWSDTGRIAPHRELRANPRNRVIGIRARYHVNVQSSLIDDTSRYEVFVDGVRMSAVRFAGDLGGRRAERRGLQRALAIAATRGDIVAARDVRVTSHRGILSPGAARS
jgi:hypothetical protein